MTTPEPEWRAQILPDSELGDCLVGRIIREGYSQVTPNNLPIRNYGTNPDDQTESPP